MLPTTPAAFALAFGTGAISSIGPCVAPRFIAVAGLCANRSAREALLCAGAFVAGLASLYASLGFAAALVLHDAAFSTASYLGIAAMLAVGGIVTLRADGACRHPRRAHVSTGVGGAFLLGASSGLAVSPCCAPALTAIVAYASAAGDPIGGALLLGCFAAGHSLPLFAAAAGAGTAGSVLERYSVRNAASLVSGTLMLALCAYYAVLA